MMVMFISPVRACLPVILTDTITYPAKVVINGKALVVMEPWQLKYINDHFIVGLDECTVTSDSLFQVVADFLTLYTSQAKLINTQAAAIDICDSLHASDVRLLALDSAQIKKQKKALWWKNFGMGAGWTVAAAELVIFVIIPKLKE